ncbi:MAG: DUF47 family protein [Bacteroidales bacterium]|nr:DUF47 family protein [Bacteroidales bacterium]
MKLNSFLQFFVTKETKFFPIYIKQSELLVHATKTLLEMLNIDNYDERKLLGRKIKKDETDGDELFRNLYKMLDITFITPFDREDVNELASNLDDSLDIIDDCSKNILMYQPKRIDNQLLETAKYLHECAELLLDIIKKLEFITIYSNDIIDNCDKIKHIEHIIDSIYFDYISNLFNNDNEYIELVKNKNIAETFENASDVLKNVADTIRTIVIKKS